MVKTLVPQGWQNRLLTARFGGPTGVAGPGEISNAGSNPALAIFILLLFADIRGGEKEGILRTSTRHFCNAPRFVPLFIFLLLESLWLEWMKLVFIMPHTERQKLADGKNSICC